MSGHTPVAMLRSIGRMTSTLTPFFSMMAREIRISPSVWDGSGERFRVQLRKRALRSEKSHLLVVQYSFCLSFNTGRSAGRSLERRTSP
jgi:hypothetical protein